MPAYETVGRDHPGAGSEVPYLVGATVRRFMTVRVGDVIRRHRISRQIPPLAVLGSPSGGGHVQRIRVHVRGRRDIAMLPHRNEDAHRFCQELAELHRTGRLPGRA